ncbi:hypothetical protein As57867_016372, partial [Aphanomyces stellatus]
MDEQLLSARKKTAPYAFLEDDDVDPSGQQHPYVHAGWLSLSCYEWVTPLIHLGAKQPLMAYDVWDLATPDTCAGMYDRFLAAWSPTTRVSTALVRCFRRDLVAAGAFLTLSILSQVVQPLLVQGMLEYLADEPVSLGIANGYALMALMVTTTFFQSLFLNYGYFLSTKVGINMRSVAMDVVYQKALRLSASARHATTSGEIVTLMSSDSERLLEAANDGLWIVVAPLAFVCSIALTWIYFGVWPAASGTAATVVVLLGSSHLAAKIGATRLRVTSITEERVKVTSEMLQGIRVMKFYAWEPAIMRRLEALRQHEASLLRRLNFYRVLNVEFLFLSPVFVGAAVLSTYIGLGNTLDSTRIFTMIAVINLGRIALYHFPRA